MTGYVAIEMPTDMHATRATEIEQDPSPRTAQGVTRLTVHIPSSTRTKSTGIRKPTQPRWKTPEFFLYGLVFCTVVPIMIWIPIRLSSGMSLFYKLLNPPIDLLACSFAPELSSVQSETLAGMAIWTFCRESIVSSRRTVI